MKKKFICLTVILSVLFVSSFCGCVWLNAFVFPDVPMVTDFFALAFFSGGSFAYLWSCILELRHKED